MRIGDGPIPAIAMDDVDDTHGRLVEMVLVRGLLSQCGHVVHMQTKVSRGVGRNSRP
jgi:hypothetical protein